MGDKSNIVESLLGEKKSAPRKLIEEIGDTSQSDENIVEPISNDGPSMMEMMMAAQLEAKKADDEVKQKEREKQSKSFGGGFKKGFFGSSSSKPVQKKAVPSAQTASKKNESVPPIPPYHGDSDIPTIARKTANSLVIDEVQEAMSEETHPLLAKVKKGDWATPDLMNTLHDNPILAHGLNNPKCMAALTLLQSDPAEAKKRFEKDPDVSLFLQEFGRVMSSHFTSLGASQDTQQKQSSTSSALPIVQEIGPLHAEAINRDKQTKYSVSSSGGVSSDMTVGSSSSAEDDARVKEIVQNDELRGLLMDVQLQEILRECSDPVKFQMHMRNPATAEKIKKLYAAGLVGTTT